MNKLTTGTVQQAKTALTAPTVPKKIVAPKYKVSSGIEPGLESINVLIFGNWGSGKTYTIRGLLELGLKVLYVNTDFGAGGLRAITIPLRQEGKEHLLENLRHIPTFDLLDDFSAFMAKPEQIFPEIYEWDPDVIFWDGLHGFQQILIAQEITGLDTKDGTRDIRDDYSVDGKEWQLVRNATINGVHSFLKLNNRRTGKVWHHIVTCQEDIRNAKNEIGSAVNHVGVEQKVPLIQGSAQQIIAGAFDLIIRTKKDREGTHKYVISGQGNSLRTKKRGFNLPDELPADFSSLWKTLMEQEGLTAPVFRADLVVPE